MKIAIVAVFVCLLGLSSAGGLTCSHKKINIPTDWIDMVSPCVKEMKKQVQAELDASLQYMAMGAYFSRDVVNRPGFANLFFDSAKEERQHSIKLISYLLNRGELTSEVSSLIKRINIPDKTEWVSGVDALKDALKLEAQVTKKIRKVIEVCEDPSKSSSNKEETTNFNDYELVDYLTGEFLKEQYDGQRDLAGKISTLEKMMERHGALGEFLYDKTLLG